MDDFSRVLALKIGLNIKNLRQKKYPEKGSVAACAAAFGVDYTYFVRWEAGRVLPTDENQAKLAEFFGVTVAQLRGDAPLVLCDECVKKDEIIERMGQELEEKDKIIRQMNRSAKIMEGDILDYQWAARVLQIALEWKEVENIDPENDASPRRTLKALLHNILRGGFLEDTVGKNPPSYYKGPPRDTCPPEIIPRRLAAIYGSPIIDPYDE